MTLLREYEACDSALPVTLEGHLCVLELEKNSVSHCGKQFEGRPAPLCLQTAPFSRHRHDFAIREFVGAVTRSSMSDETATAIRSEISVTAS